MRIDKRVTAREWLWLVGSLLPVPFVAAVLWVTHGIGPPDHRDLYALAVRSAVVEQQRTTEVMRGCGLWVGLSSPEQGAN